jgi:hypothetical protein
MVAGLDLCDKQSCDIKMRRKDFNFEKLILNEILPPVTGSVWTRSMNLS